MPIMTVFPLLLPFLFLCSITTIIYGYKDAEFYAVKGIAFVPFEEAQDSMSIFKAKSTVDYRPIRIDLERKQILIGARNKVIRLHAMTFTELETLEWSPDTQAIESCKMLGQDKDDCQNFIRLIHIQQEKVLVCGTNAFSPACSWRSVSGLNQPLSEEFEGAGLVPYSPTINSTYVMTASGELYSGAFTDFNALDASILRMAQPPSHMIIRTVRNDNRWLNNPNFVGSFDIGEFIYFFFREKATDQTLTKPAIYESRVARVCKNDIGGDTLLQNVWTTFTKAKLSCTMGSSEAGDHLLSFDFIQSVAYVKDQNMIVAAFTTAENGIGLVGSAICSYNMTQLAKAFSGPFKQQNINGLWEKVPNQQPRFNCEVNGRNSERAGRTQKSLVESQQYQLMYLSVESNTGQPLDKSAFETYTHMVLDYVSVKNYGVVNVIFVVTKSGLLKKFVQLPNVKDLCLVEVLPLGTEESPVSVTDMQLHHDIGALIIGTQSSVIKLPVERCSRFNTKQKCLDSKDPYCGWDKNIQTCTSAPGRIVSQHFWDQNIDKCPNTNLPVDGSFGDWTKWFVCPQEGGTSGENCACRERKCNNPTPALGGKSCVGPHVQVANCTRHGGWSLWSEWSVCSSSCGEAVRSRNRQCSNPSAAYGGKSCLGADTQQERCANDPCPIPTPPPVNGDNDFRGCNQDPCDEIRRWSVWTPWLQLNTSSTGSVWLQRFKFACRARISDAKLLMITEPRSQEKVCIKGSKDCTDTPAFQSTEGSWTDWSHWTTCSVQCGGGSQTRFRTCAGANGQATNDCPGYGLEKRDCNSHSCEGSWSCWTNFGQCSVTCGKGIRQRMRECPLSPGVQPCYGSHLETESCSNGPCVIDAYAEWSSWSACNEIGAAVRIRPCLSATYCKGVPDMQMRRCNKDERGPKSDLIVASATGSGQPNSVALITGIVGAFVGGVVTVLACLFLIVRRQSNCLWTFMPKPRPEVVKNTPPTPSIAKANIYTPPPSLRNIHPVTSLTLNPMNPGQHDADKDDYETVPDFEQTKTLLKHMRTSMNRGAYL